ncbi:hypothetical protein AHAT_14590 [Agarivorans sp. Toyoura001]|uniref:hypothetical protein n=1 Tax=Agarivorans sp. Toyoura001 TaxID=2283141 RepID=UPI0010DA4DD9|nr:hypothetical protein [Agarivorans sp. Toyoura001]GDY25569.1 hypothetical protein AHAT_14590 [Agarivorans sp. Toyoura001]
MNNKILASVLEALNNIDDRFYGVDDIAYCSGNLIDREAIRNLERRFMIEFSIKYASIMDRERGFYKEVKYDFEVPKKFMWYENPDYRIRETWERLNNSIGSEINMHDYWSQEPDFLVHANQNDKSPENQKLIIEAKTNPNTSRNEMLKDIFHTCIYANKYNFQNNVLLLVNISEKRWRKCLEDYISENYYHGAYRNFKKIFVIFKETYHCEPKFFCFEEIIGKCLTRKSR